MEISKSQLRVSTPRRDNVQLHMNTKDTATRMYQLDSRDTTHSAKLSDVTVIETLESALGTSATVKVTDVSLGSNMFFGSVKGIQLSFTTSPEDDLITCQRESVCV